MHWVSIVTVCLLLLIFTQLCNQSLSFCSEACQPFHLISQVAQRLRDVHFEYAYDHNNKRRLKVVKDSKGKVTTTWYISDDAEIREGKLIKFARLGSHRVAKTSKSDDTFTPEVYYIKQHLGSTELTVDNSAQVINAFNYEPFGDVEAQFGQSDKTVYRFTDKEQDKESGLGYFSQRYMNHSYGQFITPDPVFSREARFTDPQRWSPYAYGRGNPIAYVDSEGKWVVQVTAGVIGAAVAGFTEAYTNPNHDKWSIARKAAIGGLVAAASTVPGGALVAGAVGEMAEQIATDDYDAIKVAEQAVLNMVSGKFASKLTKGLQPKPLPNNNLTQSMNGMTPSTTPRILANSASLKAKAKAPIVKEVLYGSAFTTTYSTVKKSLESKLDSPTSHLSQGDSESGGDGSIGINGGDSPGPSDGEEGDASDKSEG